jgi:hypothetical protein
LGPNEANVADGIREWLEALSLGQYTVIFADNEIDPEAFPFLTEEYLKDIGVSLGARRKILSAITRTASADPSKPITQPQKDQSVGAVGEIYAKEKLGMITLARKPLLKRCNSPVRCRVN